MTTTPTFSTLNVAVEHQIATITLHRPNSANAVTRQMLIDLIDVADWLDGNEAIHFVIITGHGKIFAAGQDLKELHSDLSSERTRRVASRSLQRLAQEMMVKLESLEQISFSVIQGSAYGAGVAIAMTTDFRIMADHALLGLPETKLGLFLTYGAMPRLVKAVGASKAKDLVMFARDVTAEDALGLGLVEAILPKDELLTETYARIDQLRTMDMRALRITKRIAQAASAVSVGDILISEPDIVEGALAEGELLPRLETFLNRTR